jgi:hypothetical protein
MSELAVGSLKGLAANSFVIDVASGSSLDLSAGAVLPSGSVLQVVSTTTETSFTTTSGTFTNVTGLSVSITPSSTSNRVILICSTNVSHNANNNSFMTFARGGTNLGNATNGMLQFDEPSANYVFGQSFSFVDSPSSTSALTYTVQARTFANIFTAVTADRTSSLIAMEIAG